jgi:hypothetical protein
LFAFGRQHHGQKKFRFLKDIQTLKIQIKKTQTRCKFPNRFCTAIIPLVIYAGYCYMNITINDAE